jgi:hypothetical protein
MCVDVESVTLHEAHSWWLASGMGMPAVYSLLPARIKAFFAELRRIKRKRAACKGNEFLVQE